MGGCIHDVAELSVAYLLVVSSAELDVGGGTYSHNVVSRETVFLSKPRETSSSSERACACACEYVYLTLCMLLCLYK